MLECFISHLSRSARILLVIVIVACLWAPVAAGAWWFQPGPRGQAFLVGVATTITLAGVIIGCTVWGNKKRWEKQQDLLIWTIANFTQHAAKAPTVPLRQFRRVV